jgi:hypothetical protein
VSVSPAPTEEKEMTKKRKQPYPTGWDEERIRKRQKPVARVRLRGFRNAYQKTPQSEMAPTRATKNSSPPMQRWITASSRLGIPLGADNEQIDADLAREFGDDHAGSLISLCKREQPCPQR